MPWDNAPQGNEQRSEQAPSGTTPGLGAGQAPSGRNDSIARMRCSAFEGLIPGRRCSREERRKVSTPSRGSCPRGAPSCPQRTPSFPQRAGLIAHRNSRRHGSTTPALEEDKRSLEARRKSSKLLRERGLSFTPKSRDPIRRAFEMRRGSDGLAGPLRLRYDEKGNVMVRAHIPCGAHARLVALLR